METAIKNWNSKIKADFDHILNRHHSQYDQESLQPGLSEDLTRRLELDEQEKMSLPWDSGSSKPEHTFVCVWSEIIENDQFQSDVQ